MLESGTLGVDGRIFGVKGGAFGIDDAVGVNCSGKSIETVS